MEPEEIAKYVDAVMVEFVPVLRGAVHTWARLGVIVPTPQELAESSVAQVLGLGGTDDGQ